MRAAKFKIYQGDVLDQLKKIPDRVVQTVITSPPYWGLRDYGTAEWVGGNEECDHSGKKKEARTRDTYNDSGNYNSAYKNLVHRNTAGSSVQFGGVCVKCGAKRIDSQIGSEESPDCLGWARGENCAMNSWATGCHVCRMVLVFREVRRVLRDDGTVWLNYGDTYSSGVTGYKGSGNLVGIPWRVALALQQDGWVLRQDIIWHKPDPMPESIRNRCTKAHEYVFLLAKKMGYYYDAEAIKVPLKMSVEAYGRMLDGKRRSKSAQLGDCSSAGRGSQTDGFNSMISEGKTETYVPSGANKRSVWTIVTENYSEAHFATFPTKLVEPCVLAGTSQKGCCARCRAPIARVVDKEKVYRDRPNEFTKRTREPGTGNACPNTVAGVEVKTKSWARTCNCDTDETIPCLVLDPFSGSGTTVGVALKFHRDGIGIELNEEYVKMSYDRIHGLQAKAGFQGL